VHLGHRPWFGLLPPLALWFLGDYVGEGWAEMWVRVGTIAFLVSATALLALSLPYWKRLAQLHREVGRAKSAASR
jgi:hypothetical protein